MIHSKNHEKLSKFVKVVTKILLVSSFGTWCIFYIFCYGTFVTLPFNVLSLVGLAVDLVD